MEKTQQQRKAGMASRWSDWLDSLIPEEFLAEPDLRLRSRVLANILTVGTVVALFSELCVLLVGFFADSSTIKYGHQAAAIMLLVYGVAYKILRDYKSITIAANLVLSALFVTSAVFYTMFHLENGPPMVLWVTIVTLAFIMGGKAVGYSWLGIIFTTAVAVSLIGESTISALFPQGKLVPHSDILLIFASLSLLGAACGIYETVATQFREQLDYERNHFRHLSEHDSLTGLLNRRALEATLDSVARGVISNVRQCALVYLDLDDFKSINDRLGHSIGDLVLVEVSNRIQHSIRDSDFAARIGGDEFVVGMIGTRSREVALKKADEILDALSRPMAIGNMRLRVGASAGLAMYPSDTTNILDTVRIADKSMYRAKASTTRIVEIHESGGAS